MGPIAALDALVTAAPQDEGEEPAAGPDLAELAGSPAMGTLGPELAPEAFDAAILAALVSP